jgi:uncharacterized protein YndB with AHSA1/START domain
MIERQTALPITPLGLWRVLTDPALLAEWFGAAIEWDLRPGGAMCAIDDTGTTRDGVIVEVDDERCLRYRWWPSDEPDGVSEVTYTIDADDEGSILTVIERPVFEPVSAVSVVSALYGRPDVWTAWDTRGLGIIECASGRSTPCLQVGASAHLSVNR